MFLLGSCDVLRVLAWLYGCYGVLISLTARKVQNAMYVANGDWDSHCFYITEWLSGGICVVLRVSVSCLE